MMLGRNYMCVVITRDDLSKSSHFGSNTDCPIATAFRRELKSEAQKRKKKCPTVTAGGTYVRINGECWRMVGKYADPSMVEYCKTHGISFVVVVARPGVKALGRPE